MTLQDIRLGPQETRLLFGLEEKGVSTFTSKDAKEILGTTPAAVLLVISGLRQKGRIRRIERGKYLLVPSRAGIMGAWSEDAWLIVPRLADRYYVGFWTAMSYWGMTEQVPLTVFVATPKRRKRILKFGSQKFQFVTISEKKFFGFVKERAGDGVFNISSREKTIVDGLVHPQYCGGISEVTKAMWYSREDVDWNEVLEMARKTGVNVALRRLGYLLSVLGIEGGISDRIRGETDRYPYHFLDPGAKKARLGHSKEFGLVLNRTRDYLLDWREY